MLYTYLENFKGVKRGRIKEFLERKIMVSGKIYLLYEYIEKNENNGGFIDKQFYSKKKINLEYKKLEKPKLRYFIYKDSERADLVEIKKIGYEYLQFLLENKD